MSHFCNKYVLMHVLLRLLFAFLQPHFSFLPFFCFSPAPLFFPSILLLFSSPTFLSFHSFAFLQPHFSFLPFFCFSPAPLFFPSILSLFSSPTFLSFHSLAFLQPHFSFLPFFRFSPAPLFFPSTLSLFSNPQHELVLLVRQVTLIYKVLYRHAFTAIWLPSSWPMTPDFKQLVHREITPVQYPLSTTPSML